MTKSSSTYSSLLILAFIMLSLGMVGNLLSEGLLQLNDLSLKSLIDSDESFSRSQRIWYRLALMINHFTMFLAAGLIFGYIFYRGRFSEYLTLHREPQLLSIGLWGAVMMFSYPLIGWLSQINGMIPLPDWALSGQESSFKILTTVLQMDSWSEFLMCLILVGLLPALGEEIIFRGIVQKTLVKELANPHIAILISSFLFGLTHMQLERLIPLTVLGAFLGYSYHYTGRLIVPILLHLINNSLQVISLYIIGGVDVEQLSDIPEVSYEILGPTLLITFGAFYMARRHSIETYELRS